jgi:hypothetical protein
MWESKYKFPGPQCVCAFYLSLWAAQSQSSTHMIFWGNFRKFMFSPKIFLTKVIMISPRTTSTILWHVVNNCDIRWQHYYQKPLVYQKAIRWNHCQLNFWAMCTNFSSFSPELTCFPAVMILCGGLEFIPFSIPLSDYEYHSTWMGCWSITG